MSDALLGGNISPGSAPHCDPGIEPIRRLLAWLDPDEQRAGQRYEDLRRRLLLYFRLHVPGEAETLADEVLDRVARKISEGVAIGNIDYYVVGVARNVLREHQARTRRATEAQREFASQQQSASQGSDHDAEAYSRSLARCMDKLAPGDRGMMMTYYGSDGALRIRARRVLAENFAISMNALHNRALRLRKQLERCVESQMAKRRSW